MTGDKSLAHTGTVTGDKSLAPTGTVTGEGPQSTAPVDNGATTGAEAPEEAGEEVPGAPLGQGLPGRVLLSLEEMKARREVGLEANLTLF